MAFLTGILASVLEWVLMQLASWGINLIKEEEKTAANNAQASQDAKAAAGAQTDADRVKAITQISKDTF